MLHPTHEMPTSFFLLKCPKCRLIFASLSCGKQVSTHNYWCDVSCQRLSTHKSLRFLIWKYFLLLWHSSVRVFYFDTLVNWFACFIIAFFNSTKIPIFNVLDTICVRYCKHQSGSYIYHQKILGWSRCHKTSSHLPQAIGNLLFLNVSSNDITEQFFLCV